MATGVMKAGKSEFTIGTWNVRTLKGTEKLNLLTKEMDRLKWNVLGISELRWKGVGEITSEEGHKIWYAGERNKHELGVGILVNKNTVAAVSEYKPISSRIISVRIMAKPFNISVIQVYAPSSSHTDEEIEEFYQDLEKTIREIPKKDIVVTQGDWNAKIGTDAYNQWRGTAGKFGVGKTNERGHRLLEFAKQCNLIVANTLHNHKMSRRTTWHSPDGLTHNQIDYIMISKRVQSSIKRSKTRTFPGADIGSDHDLVMMTFKIRLNCRKKKNNNRVRFDLEKLKDPEIKKQYQQELQGRFAPLLLLNNVQEICDSFTNIVKETAKKVLGTTKTTKKPWITPEILKKCDTRREQKGKRFTNDDEMTKYKKLNKVIKREILEAKDNWLKEQTLEIEKNLKCHNTRKAYALVKSLTTTKKPRVNVIEDKNGKLLTNNEEVIERWREYCHGLYNHTAVVDTSIIEEEMEKIDEEDEPPIIRSEIEEAIKHLKSNKAPGIDNINGELIKEGGTEIVDILLKICNDCLTKKEWPTQWTESILITIPKKGNLKACENYRTISLISHASKILLRIIQNRIKPRIEEVLSEEQAGFRKGRSTVEQISNLRIICEKYRNANRTIYHNFIDFKKAFDRVWHGALWHTMNKHKVGASITTLIKKLYESAKSTVLINNSYSQWFTSNVGVRQGCLLSPGLFNLFLERVMTDALEDDTNGIICGGRRINNLRFADDIDIVASTEEGLRDLTDKINNAANRYGMEISGQKSKTMVTGTEPKTILPPISVNGEHLEQLKAFKYLGSFITEDATSNKEILARLGTATSALVRLDKIWKEKHLPLPTKINLLRAIVISTALYGCETWTLNAKMEKKIQAFDMRCLRKVLMISWKQKKTNEYVKEEIKRRYGKLESLLNIIKIRKLTWYGHVIRDKGTMTNTIMQGKVEGERSRGRPKRMYVDDIKEWTGKDIIRTMRRTENRRRWKEEVLKWVHQRPTRLWL